LVGGAILGVIGSAAQEGFRLGFAMTRPECDGQSVSGPGFATLARMFIHRIRITGCSDRGAWLWRPLPDTSAHA